MAKLTTLCSSLQLTKSASVYSLYVLGLLLFAYLLNQLDRYTLAIVTKPLAQEIHYGDLGCMKNESIFSNIDNLQCTKLRSQTQCEDKDDGNGTYGGCKWDFTGYGFDYQILAGPVFILIYTFAGIPLGLAADSYNRKLSGPDKETKKDNGWVRTACKKELFLDFGVLLGICVFFWSLCTLLSGFVNNYWELAVLRFGLGLGQSGCSPFATSLISDYFAEQLRGAALGVYNWGIYTGYSMSFAVGNFITQANINNQGWRWTFILAGIPGLFLGLLIMITVREPKRLSPKGKPGNDETEEKMNDSMCSKLHSIRQSFFRPSVLLLCFAGSIRNAAGYVWAYNTQAYFEGIGETRTQIGFYMSWIPMVAGSIGVVLGGFISDRFVKKSGPHGRIWTLIASQMFAAPFAAGVLLLPTPWAYISLIPTYIIGEMWVGVTLAVLIELVPKDIKTTSVAVYFFIISNIGGNMPLMVPVMKPLFEQLGYIGVDALRYTLLVLYPGEYIVGSLLFLLTLFVLQKDIAYIQTLGNNKESKSDVMTQMENANNNRDRELTKM